MAASLSFGAAAHPGGLAADGCHNDRKNGGGHCHRQQGGSGSSAERPQRVSGGGASYANCSAARAAGAAPVRRGDPGYGRHLDRDGDGVGCE
ncbi:excalibur calcium-binding domain-containing protein [Sphingopyxis sp. C-1]|uniref:excalibur calcium-binding domain-containing protein n=1 Tax=Sphingopyxis sp. C-1 TaxID=262667 RepID=UPI001EE7406C|nr:excalibur calcium-binding domain-containing protein [Sphingopyxis sp. C-1]